MKSWVHSTSAKGQTFLLKDVPAPEPGVGEIVVRVKAASFNRGEIFAAQNAPAISDGKPAGIECAGEIVRFGSSVAGFKAGERVMGRAKMAFSELAIFQAEDAIPVPANFSWEEAACASITYQVAHDMLFGEGILKAGEWLLITGVSSGVGIAALQLGKLRGAKVIGTSRSQAKLAKLTELGLDHGLLYEDQDFVRQILSITGGYGVDVIVNNVGGGVFARCLEILAYQGRLATVGHLDGIDHAEIDLKAQHRKRLKLYGVSNQLRPVQERAQSVSLFVCDILPAMKQGKIVPVIDQVFEFHECDYGLEYLVSNNQVGKVVIRS
ncbi:MAG: zinc-binding dehydrogenase [Desulfuromonadales bacterium]|jgi:NADPH2:quinone reductase